MRTRLVIPLITVLIAAGLVACGNEPVPADVAVVVLDDFSPDVVPAKHSAETNCANTGRGANEIETGGGGDGLPRGVSHGKAVYETLHRSLQDAGFTSPTPLEIRHERLVPGYLTDWKHPGLGKRLLLVGMDTADYDTGQIATDLPNTLDHLHRTFGVNRFVLNMSFVITPCDVPAWLAAHGKALSNDELIASYRRLVDRNPDATRLHEVIDGLAGDRNRSMLPTELRGHKELREISQRVATNAFYGPWTTKDIKELMNGQDVAARAYRRVTTDDPLHKYLSSKPFGGGVASVGAAGNGVYTPAGTLVRIDHPFAPAIWDTVVSTSALHSGQRAIYSNSGEVMLDGSAVLTGAPSTLDIRGTSFAAPRLSARQAVHLMRGHPTTCAGASSSPHLPPLGYTDITIETARPQWDNLTLPAAVTTHCPLFPAT